MDAAPAAAASAFSDAAHAARVASVQAGVRARPPGKPLGTQKATRSHTLQPKTYKSASHLVDVSPLTHVLRVDAAARTVTAEGQVSMAQLAAATLPYGLALPVVPELPAFTVAGLVNGLGIQSSSHRYGLFPDALVALELVLASGDAVVVTSGPLFESTPGSYGSVAVVVAATLRLVRAAQFVVCTYVWFDSLPAFTRAVEEAVGCGRGGGGAGGDASAGAFAPPTFVDGYVFSARSSVLVLGEYAAHPGGDNAVWDAGELGGEWYHHHVLRMAAEARAARARAGGSGAPRGALPPSAAGRPAAQDALLTTDYLQRLARGFWWEVDEIVGARTLTSPVGLGGWLGVDRALRRAVDAAVVAEVATLPTGASSWAGQSANAAWTPAHAARVMVHQDMGVRLGRLEDTLLHVGARLGVSPLWVCPFRVWHDRGALWNTGWRAVAAANVAAGVALAPPVPGWGGDAEGARAPAGFPLMAVDVGIYGEPQAWGFRARSALRALQRFVDVPAFWGMSFLARDELESVYDFSSYEAVRAAAGARGALPDIREKTTFWDPAAPDEPPIFAWRLHRAGLAGAAAGAGALVLAGVGLALARLWRVV